MHLRDVVPLVNIFDCDTASTLHQQPVYELSAALALLQSACEKRHVAHILKDATGGSTKFFPGAAFLAEGVAQLVIFQDHAVRIEACAVACLLTETSGELARGFCFHSAHDLELRSTAASGFSTNNQHLCAALTS